MEIIEDDKKYGLEYVVNYAIKFHDTWYNKNNIYNSLTSVLNLVFSVAILPILMVIFYLAKQNISSELVNYIGVAVSSFGILFAIFSMNFKYGAKADYHLSQRTRFEKIIYAVKNNLQSEQEAWIEYFKVKEEKEP